MYEAPDRYKRMISARLPGGESLGLTNQADADEGGSPLRDIQLLSRGQLAAFFATANIMAAILTTVTLAGTARLPYLIAWTVAVALVNFFAMQWSRNQAITHVGRSGRKVPRLLMIGDVTVRAALWLSLPLFIFQGLDVGGQVIMASLTAALGTAALGLVVIPACASAWLVMFVLGLSVELLIARVSIPFDHMLSILFTLGLAVFGVLAISRWAFRQLETDRKSTRLNSSHSS